MSERPRKIFFEVRDAWPSDVEAITAIYTIEVREGSASFEIDPPGAAEMGRRRDAVLESGLPYLVAERDGEVVGYAYAVPYRPRPAYRFTVESSVYVARGARRQGVARRLMEALIERCEATGRRQMIAVIGDSAHAVSIALHESLGFRLAGTLRDVGFKHGRWLDTVLMQRPLAGTEGADPAPGVPAE